MEKYISPAVASIVRICIDNGQEHGWNGRIYTRVNQQSISFQNVDDMLYILETLWNTIGFPQESTMNREFGGERMRQHKKYEIKVSYQEDGKKDRIKEELGEEDMDKKSGDQGTFVVRIRYRQNATWQGHVTWVEQDKTVPFRSALELIKLLDSTQADLGEWQDEE